LGNHEERTTKEKREKKENSLVSITSLSDGKDKFVSGVYRKLVPKNEREDFGQGKKKGKKGEKKKNSPIFSRLAREEKRRENVPQQACR